MVVTFPQSSLPGEVVCQALVDILILLEVFRIVEISSGCRPAVMPGWFHGIKTRAISRREGLTLCRTNGSRISRQSSSCPWPYESRPLRLSVRHDSGTEPMVWTSSLHPRRRSLQGGLELHNRTKRVKAESMRAPTKPACRLHQAMSSKPCCRKRLSSPQQYPCMPTEVKPFSSFRKLANLMTSGKRSESFALEVDQL